MSASQQYRITIGLDDAELKKKLAGLQKGFTNTLFGGGGSSGGGGSTSTTKNLAKLGAIAVGIGGILAGINKLVSMTVQASPILQSMLKLLNVGIMFVLRPIGDFLAFFIRPFMILFLRESLKFYKAFAPELRILGTKLGQALLPDFSNIGKLIVDSILGTGGGNPLQKALMVLFSEFEWPKIEFPPLPETKLPTLDDIITTLSSIGEKLKTVLAPLVGIFDKNKNTIVQVLTGLTSLFGLSGVLISAILTDKILPIVQGIQGFFQIILNDLTNKVGTAWNGIVLFFENMGADLTSTLTAGWDILTSFFQDIIDWWNTLPEILTNIFAPQQQAPVSGQANPVGGNTVNFYDTIVQGAEGAFEFGEDMISQLQSALAGRTT